jgi:hypothetical protein
MADSDIPNKFGLATRWVLVVIALFVFFLEAADAFRAGDPLGGAIFSGLFVVTFLIAVKWDWLAHRIGERKVTMFYLGLALVCAAGLGLAVGKLMGRTATADTPVVAIAPIGSDTGRVIWSFDELPRDRSYFLGFQRLGDEEVRVSGFAAHGRNTSADPITHFKGYVRSDKTNEELPIYLLAEDQNAPPGAFGRNIPTLAEETFGIPGKAEFGITTFNKSIFQGGVDGTPFSKFLRDFGPFTVVLQYDGITVRRNFSKQDIEAQLQFFEQQIDPSRGSTPRVVRKPDASPPVQPTFPFPIPPAVPQEKPKNGN